MTEVGRVTAIIDGDISALISALNTAKSQATNAVSGIERGVKGQISSGISGAFSGDWGTAGKNIGNTFVTGITSSFGPLGDALGGVATALGPTGIVALAAIAGSAVIIKAAWEASSAWEMGMSQISKTTGIGKGTTEFSQLNEDLKELYSTMPTTATEIQNVAQAAGSLGIETDSIAGFTRVALEMGSAFDIPAEQAAVSIGKVESQLKKLPDGVEDSAQFARHWGSAVDHAGNSMNATEAEVLDFSTRAAGALSLLGGSAYELAGWGGVTASVFSSSQLAAGSFNAALTQLTGTTKGSVAAQEKAAELLGITSDEFSNLMATDPTDTVLRLGNALEELDPAEATKAAGILGGGYGDDFFKKMIGHTDEWRGKIDEVVEAGEKGESIGRSFESGSDNAKSAIQELKNSLNTILIDMGGPILDAFSPVISGLAGGLNKIREIGENLWDPLTTVLGPLTTSVSTIVSGIGTMAGIQLDGLVMASGAINTAFDTGSRYVTAIREELIERLAGTGAYQTISDGINGIRTAFSNLYDKAAEVISKISDGLTNAIPDAISGTADALGTLAEKAGLGGVADTAGGVFDFFGDVNARVWGEDVGDEVAGGVKSSSLKNAPKDALESGKADALAAADDIGGQIGHAIGEKVSYTSTQSIDKISAEGKAKWKGSRGEVVGEVSVGGVDIVATKDATVSSTDILLKSSGGLIIDRRNIYSGEFAGRPGEAIQDMILSNPDYFGNLTDIEQAGLVGDTATTDELKIKAGMVDVELTTEARLKELSSLDIEQLRANITEIEAEISGLSRGLRDIDTAFEEMSVDPIDMTVALQTTQARQDWDLLVKDIEGLTVRLPVELDIRVNGNDLKALIAEEIRAVYT